MRNRIFKRWNIKMKLFFFNFQLWKRRLKDCKSWREGEAPRNLGLPNTEGLPHTWTHKECGRTHRTWRGQDTQGLHRTGHDGIPMLWEKVYTSPHHQPRNYFQLINTYKLVFSTRILLEPQAKQLIANTKLINGNFEISLSHTALSGLYFTCVYIHSFISTSVFLYVHIMVWVLCF